MTTWSRSQDRYFAKTKVGAEGSAWPEDVRKGQDVRVSALRRQSRLGWLAGVSLELVVACSRNRKEGGVDVGAVVKCSKKVPVLHWRIGVQRRRRLGWQRPLTGGTA